VWSVSSVADVQKVDVADRSEAPATSCHISEDSDLRKLCSSSLLAPSKLCPVGKVLFLHGSSSSRCSLRGCVACASASHGYEERYWKRLTRRVTAFSSNKVMIRPEELGLL
jgi:hypothetical protein